MDTNGARLGGNASEIVLEIERVRPNVVVLCFALDQPLSLSRISSYWLPAIASVDNSRVNPSWPFLPVCICGTKSDLIITEANSELTKEWLETRRSVRASLIMAKLIEAEDDHSDYELDTDELADASTLRTKTLEDILTAYKCVQANAFVSGYYWAHNLQNDSHTSSNVGLFDDVPLLWLRATSILLQPVFPLFSGINGDHGGEDLTQDAKRAIRRIFRVIDMDNDNLISVDELCVFQSFCFGYRIQERELVAYIAQKRDSEPESVRAVGSGDIDASDVTASLGLTLSGFTSLFLDHVLHMNADPDPSAWQILHAFGYKWSTPRIHEIEGKKEEGATINKLCLTIPETFATLPPLPTEDFNASSFFPSFSSPSFPQNPKRRLLQLSGTSIAYSGRNRSTLLLLSSLCSRKFEGTGLGFVARLFMRYTFASGLDVLSSSNLDDIFSICSLGQPFGPLFPFSAYERDDKGGVSLHSWIHSWQALVACKPRLALVTLFELGFSVPSIGQGSLLDNGQRPMLSLDPRLALEWGHPRNQTVTSISSATRRVFVIGSYKCGKTLLIQNFLSGKRAPEDVLTRTSVNYASNESEQIFGTAAVPYGFSGQAPSIFEMNDAKITSSLPVTLAITELGEDSFDTTNTKQGEWADLLDEADAILLVVNPAQQSSIDFMKKIVSLIPDNVPAACASLVSSNVSSFIDIERGDSNHATEDLMKKGIRSLSALCEKTSSSQSEENKEGSDNQSRSVLKSVVENSELPLCIELFPFSHHEADSNSLPIFEYISALTILPGKDNPQTRERIQRAEEKAWRALLFKTGIALTSAALLILLLKKKKVI